MTRPDFCEIPNEGEPGWDKPCPACGATAEGKDPVRGVCQARFNRPKPKSILDFVLVDKHDGAVVASVPVLRR